MKVKFTLSEISELEALELRGGTGADGSNGQCSCTQENCPSQFKCTNNQCSCSHSTCPSDTSCNVSNYLYDGCKGPGA